MEIVWMLTYIQVCLKIMVLTGLNLSPWRIRWGGYVNLRVSRCIVMFTEMLMPSAAKLMKTSLKKKKTYIKIPHNLWRTEEQR